MPIKGILYKDITLRNNLHSEYSIEFSIIPHIVFIDIIWEFMAKQRSVNSFMGDKACGTRWSLWFLQLNLGATLYLVGKCMGGTLFWQSPRKVIYLLSFCKSQSEFSARRRVAKSSSNRAPLTQILDLPFWGRGLAFPMVLAPCLGHGGGRTTNRSLGWLYIIELNILNVRKMWK